MPRNDGGDKSLPPAYFDAMYADSPDPWGFETRPYEAAKYRATLDALPRERYRSAFEIGCSVGVLTELLAGRCDRLLSVDVSEAALERARWRCRHLDHVRIERMQVPVEFPDEQFDLIVVSEVGYYWSRHDLLRARSLMIDRLNPGGEALLVHWTPYVEDYPLTGDDVHDRFLSADARLAHQMGRREATYRLDLLQKGEPGRASP